jgi:hypothetical protein
MQKGYLKAMCAGASIVAILISLVLSRFFGRRLRMVSGCVCIVASMVLNFIESSQVIIIACSLAAAGTAVLNMNCLLYSFEICTKGWRGKSVVMFLLGSMLGYLVQAIMQVSLDKKVMDPTTSESYADNWRMAPLYVAVPGIIVLGIVLKVIPESPVWLIQHNHHEHARRVLARLRQRQNVQQDMTAIEEELKVSATKGTNLAFRIAFVFALQIMVGLLMSHGLLYREQLKDSKTSTSGSRYSLWFEFYAICSAVGLAFGIFLVDNVRRKTILKEFLPCLAIVSLFCGVIASATSDQSKVLKGLLFILYIAAGLSLLSVAWLSSMEMFPASKRPLLFCISLCVFYLTEGIVFLTMPSFAAAHYIFGVFCALMTVVLFMFCASTKVGAIQLKGEKKAQKEQQALADAAAIVVAGVNDAQTHGENQLQIRRQQSRFAAGAMNESTRRVPYVHQTTLDSSSSSDNIQTFTSTSINNISQSFHDDSNVSSGSQSPRVGSYVPQRSGSFDLIDEFDTLDDHSTPNLITHEISYPVQQPRSQSFLRSQSFPDADVKTETMYRRL